MNEIRKTALVTGGSRGLGKDMAINLAKNGIDIIFTYHTQKQEANETVEFLKNLGVNAFTFQFDITAFEQYDTFIETVKKHLLKVKGTANIDYLINNAGVGLYKLIEETTEDELDRMFNIHYKSAFLLTQKILPMLNNNGRIINISSGLTRFSFPGSAAYAAMKTAVETFTKYLAKELGDRQITANVVAPGAIATDFGGGRVRDDEATHQHIASITALKRVGQATDIGGVIAFLCSPEAGWINGQRIEVSGGMML